MSPEFHGVAVYNPDLLAKEELVRLFVARQALLRRLLRDLRDETGGLPQHHLLVGPRGMGKTTLLRRLRYAIEDNPELGGRWLPLVFPEEQYNIACLSDFWLNCVDALAESLESKGQHEALRAIDEQVTVIAATDDEAARRASALELLLSVADSIQRRLVLLVDNVDLVFARLDQDDWALREVLSREPRLLIMGATSHALEASFRYEKAFYDFFRVHNLDGLDEAQAFELMRHLATLTEQPRVLEVINREPARIQTLRLLSGGNPRTLVLLFNLLSQGTQGDARSDLERLLDQITPLYKHRFEELAPQAQRVVDALALHWDPSTTRDLADRLRLDVSLTSAQLHRLVKQGVVEKTRLPGSKRMGFQLSERFFNIWYLMRASRRLRRRLLLLVKFLELFFPSESLHTRPLRHVRAPQSSGEADFGLTLTQMASEAGLRHAPEATYRRAIELDSHYPYAHHNLAWLLYSTGGDLESAEQSAQKAVDAVPQNPGFTHTLACIQAARGGWPTPAALHFLRSDDEEFRRERWPHILSFFAEVVRHGHANQARSHLQALPNAEAWAPMIAALGAAEHDSAELLLGLSPELRQVVELVLAKIAPKLDITPHHPVSRR